MSAPTAPAAAPPVTQQRDLWVLMVYALLLEVLRAFAEVSEVGYGSVSRRRAHAELLGLPRW